MSDGDESVLVVVDGGWVSHFDQVWVLDRVTTNLVEQWRL